MCADGSHRFEFVSDRFCAQIGVERDRILSDPEAAFTCFIAEDLPSLIQANDAARQLIQTFDWTGRVAHPDGQRWLRMESTPSLLPNGDILWNGTQQDITQQTLAVEKVEALLREQTAILNNELVGIVTTKDRSILWANPAFEQMLGYASGELAGVPTRQLYPSEEHAQKFGALAYPQLATGEVVRARIEMLRKDGQTIWMDISGKMLEPTNGVSIWTFIDVSRLRFSEADLKAKMNELQRFNHAMVGRELQMVALKQEVNALCQAAGESVRYVVRNVEP
jgi:PAS domain S-box-containing protein